jgi:hypothetical protein
VDGDPEKAARKVAAASVVELRTVRQAKAAAAVQKAAAERPAMRAGAKRTAATMGPVIAALRSPEGPRWRCAHSLPVGPRRSCFAICTLLPGSAARRSPIPATARPAATG